MPLNLEDITEVGATAERLRESGVDEIWTSPRRRARESTDILAQALDLHEVWEDARLDEIDCGSWTGRSWREVRDDSIRGRA